MAEYRNAPRRPRAAVVLGIILIVFGLLSLAGNIVPRGIWVQVGAIIGTIWRILWPCALVAAGAYLLWASKRGKLRGIRGVTPARALPSKHRRQAFPGRVRRHRVLLRRRFDGRARDCRDLAGHVSAYRAVRLYFGGVAGSARLAGGVFAPANGALGAVFRSPHNFNHALKNA